MPTYEYVCTACGEGLEAVQKFSDPPLTVCPDCQGALRKVFSAVGVVFKGSGFYKTDSRSGGKSGGSSTPAKEAAAGAGSGGTNGSTGADSSSTSTKGSSSDGSSASSSTKSESGGGSKVA
jgi:putative FmdB family regulatory protein